MVPFRTAEDARAWLRDGTKVQPDMLLIDVRLPGMSGIELLRRLGSDVPASILISGEASMSETVEAIRLGVHDFIDKPFCGRRSPKSRRPTRACSCAARAAREKSWWRTRCIGSADGRRSRS